jgi:hypothetical protein
MICSTGSCACAAADLEGEKIRLASQRMALTTRQEKDQNPEADFGRPEDSPSA